LAQTGPLNQLQSRKTQAAGVDHSADHDDQPCQAFWMVNPDSGHAKGTKRLEFVSFPGTNAMIFKIFSPKNFAKKWRFLHKTKQNFFKS
jgi:hypothetical protein